MKDGIQLTLNLRTIRLFSIAGVFASLTVFTVNTILYSYGGDVSLWPQWAINLSYWAGSIVLAFAAIGFIPTYLALRPSGRFWAIAIAGSLAYFVALGSAGHGSVSAYYNVLQAIENNPNQQVLTDLVTPIHGYYNFLMAVCLGALFLGSTIYSIIVLIKPTLYPKWMALWNIFFIALIIYLLGDIQAFPEMARIILKGIGFHLGLLGHFILTYFFVRKGLFK